MNIGSIDHYKSFAAWRALGPVKMHELGPISNFHEQNWLRIAEMRNAVSQLDLASKQLFLKRYYQILQQMNVGLIASLGESIDIKSALEEVCTEFQFYPKENKELRRLA